MSELHDTDWSLMLTGVVNDGGRIPQIAFKCGDKKPSLFTLFLVKDSSKGHTFSEAFLNFPTFFSFLNQVESLILHPGIGKISKTFKIMRSVKGGKGKLAESGTSIMVSRRADGAVSMRILNSRLRSSIHPLLISDGLEVDTIVESLEPTDPRIAYINNALTYIQMMRKAAYHWKHNLTDAGNAIQKEENRARFSTSYDA